MKKKSNNTTTTLREKALIKLSETSPRQMNLSNAELFHELSVHEIELEMQNHELLLVQSKLNASLLEYAELFEKSPVGYFILDSNGVVENANMHACLQLKINKEDIIGNSFSCYLFNEINQDNFYLHRLSVIESGIIQDIYCKILVSDGTTFDSLIKSIVVNDENNNFKHLLCIVTDVTVQKEQEAQVVLALSKANKLNKIQSRFISLASHEFRTSLTSILTCTWLLEKYSNAGKYNEVKEFSSKIRLSVRQLTQILDEFLSQDKLESGAIQVINDTFNFYEFCQLLLVDIKILLNKGDTINFNYNGEKMLYSDKKVLYHIIVNLLSNAVKYSASKKKVNFSINVTNCSIFLQIKDNGIGIPEVDKPFIFSRFFRANNVRTKQGTGLGLSIVNDYVKLLNGIIYFESIEGHGTTFFVEIPIVQPLSN